jgi:hypothetical protein
VSLFCIIASIGCVSCYAETGVNAATTAAKNRSAQCLTRATNGVLIALHAHKALLHIVYALL